MKDAVRNAGWLQEANLIAGKWVGADGGKTTEVFNPATGEVIGVIPVCGQSETQRAIEAAHAAFASWSATTAAERATMLHEMARLIRENSEALAQMLTLEQGKPLQEARGEVSISAAYVQWFAEEARRIN